MSLTSNSTTARLDASAVPSTGTRFSMAGAPSSMTSIVTGIENMSDAPMNPKVASPA